MTLNEYAKLRAIWYRKSVYKQLEMRNKENPTKRDYFDLRIIQSVLYGINTQIQRMKYHDI